MFLRAPQQMKHEQRGVRPSHFPMERREAAVRAAQNGGRGEAGRGGAAVSLQPHTQNEVLQTLLLYRRVLALFIST